jgi:hypothetical protein
MVHSDCVFFFITIAVFSLFSLASLSGYITLFFYIHQGCPEVSSCNYQIRSINSEANNDSTLYTFVYVINNQYTCSNFCIDPLDMSSCPTNNTSCSVTSDVSDFCRHQGYEKLFSHCINNRNLSFLIMCGIVTVLGFAITISVAIAGRSMISYRNKLTISVSPVTNQV